MQYFGYIKGKMRFFVIPKRDLHVLFIFSQKTEEERIIGDKLLHGDAAYTSMYLFTAKEGCITCIENFFIYHC
jgi:hypothetical protein